LLATKLVAIVLKGSTVTSFYFPYSLPSVAELVEAGEGLGMGLLTKESA
jgi:hypothetical protein